MARGILFSKAEKTLIEYQKSFCFAETPKSAFWDGDNKTKVILPEVTSEEAKRYDEIMKKIIFAQIF